MSTRHAQQRAQLVAIEPVPVQPEALAQETLQLAQRAVFVEPARDEELDRTDPWQFVNFRVD